VIDVTILSGFLGAGKTTWLSHFLETSPPGIIPGQAGGTLAVVVNDFAAEGVDDRLLRFASAKLSHAEIRLVAGGCVCCDKREALTACLVSMVASRHRASGCGNSGIEHVFIETSGLADPTSIVDLITTHPVLQANLMLKELVVVLDSVNGAAQLRHNNLARSQARCADRIILSKADLADESCLASLAAMAAQINPGAVLSRAVGGKESELPIAAAPSAALLNDLAPWGEAEDIKPSAWTAQLSPRTSWAEYALWLDAVTRAHPHEFLRTKGIINTPNGPLVLQSVGSVIAQPRPAAQLLEPVDGGSTSMVFITQGLDPERLASSLAAFVPSAAEQEF
jgi:G3E family GTPase